VLPCFPRPPSLVCCVPVWSFWLFFPRCLARLGLRCASFLQRLVWVVSLFLVTRKLTLDAVQKCGQPPITDLMVDLQSGSVLCHLIGQLTKNKVRTSGLGDLLRSSS
jgi:hypothetical protein